MNTTKTPPASIVIDGARITRHQIATYATEGVLDYVAGRLARAQYPGTRHTMVRGDGEWATDAGEITERHYEITALGAQVGNATEILGSLHLALGVDDLALMQSWLTA